MSQPIPILAISSSVALGHVGLSAIVPTLQACARSAAALPTTILSNHPGLPHCAGTRISPDTLAAMVDAFAEMNWLASFDTVLTGYLPSADHVAFACTTIDRVRAANPSARVICDPIIGDDPKGIYIEAAAATAIRDQLLPKANVLLPNRFELAYLTDLTVSTPKQALVAAQSLAPAQVIAKSIPVSDQTIATLDITPTDCTMFTTQTLSGVPHGTGDMLSGLIAAGRSTGHALAALKAVIEASLDRDHLQIISSSSAWLNAPPLTTTPLSP